jgi:hypothetical protein
LETRRSDDTVAGHACPIPPALLGWKTCGDRTRVALKGKIVAPDCGTISGKPITCP